MQNYLLLLLASTFTTFFSYSRVAINTTGAAPNASAMLDITSTNRGLLIPRMTQAQRNAIFLPATGLLVYQTDAGWGFYYNSGTPAIPIWTNLPSVTTVWRTTGNSGINPATNYLGTIK